LWSILKVRRELRELALNWRQWAEKIAEATRKILDSCEVYVFGSVVEERATGGSDVDLLIISTRLPENWKGRGELKARIEEEAGLPPSHPFEIHLASPAEAILYFRHAKKMIKLAPVES